MENSELIYEMAKRLDMIIEVTKNGVYQGRYKFINNKLHKLKEDEKEKMQRMQQDKIIRPIQS
jgi:ClpP class serine protease